MNRLEGFGKLGSYQEDAIDMTIEEIEEAKHEIRQDLNREVPSKATSAARWTVRFPPFIEALTERLKLGEYCYKDKNFSSDPLYLLEQACEEILDNAIYSYIAWVRMQNLMSEIRTNIGGLNDALGGILGRYTEGCSEREQGPEPQVRSSDSGSEREAEKHGV